MSKEMSSVSSDQPKSVEIPQHASPGEVLKNLEGQEPLKLSEIIEINEDFSNILRLEKEDGGYLLHLNLVEEYKDPDTGEMDLRNKRHEVNLPDDKQLAEKVFMFARENSLPSGQTQEGEARRDFDFIDAYVKTLGVDVEM